MDKIPSVYLYLYGSLIQEAKDKKLGNTIPIDIAYSNLKFRLHISNKTKTSLNKCLKELEDYKLIRKISHKRIELLPPPKIKNIPMDCYGNPLW